MGLALKGLLLKAQALGVGSCILTAPLVFIGGVDQLLNLHNVQIKCFVTLGLADEALAHVRLYLRLATRWGWMSAGQYEHVAVMVAEIGRLLGGWKKATRT